MSKIARCAPARGLAPHTLRLRPDGSRLVDDPGVPQVALHTRLAERCVVPAKHHDLRHKRTPNTVGRSLRHGRVRHVLLSDRYVRAWSRWVKSSSHRAVRSRAGPTGRLRVNVVPLP